MRLHIVLWPQPVLLVAAAPITEVDDDLRQVVAEMRRVMFDLRGVGLAAPQVGVARRVMLTCPSGTPGDEQVMLNPEVLESSGADDVADEGCLSLPGLYGPVERPAQVRVRYQDLDLRTHEMDLDGFPARVFQHELDHLNGVMFIDRMDDDDVDEVQAQLDAFQAAYDAARLL